MFTVTRRNTLSGRSAPTVRARTAVASRFSAGNRVGPSPRPERVAAAPAVASQSGKVSCRNAPNFSRFWGGSRLPTDSGAKRGRPAEYDIFRTCARLFSRLWPCRVLAFRRTVCSNMGTLRRTNRHPSAPPVRAALPGLHRRWSHACRRLQRFDHATLTARAVGPRRSASVGSFLMCVFR